MVAWIVWPLVLLFQVIAWIFGTLIQPLLFLISEPFFLYLVPPLLILFLVIYIFQRVRAEGAMFLIYNLEEILSFPFLAAIAYLVFIQVYFRYILNDPFVWAEEITLLCFHWLVFLGMAMAYKHGEKLTMDTFVNQLPVNLQRKIYIFVEILIFLTLLLLIYYGIVVAILEWTYPTPALEFPQTYQSASFPVGMTLMAIHSGRHLWALIAGTVELGHRSSPAV
jgi:TRAP-type C4-dicarboxylate transport system permease small subunit